MKSYEQRYKSLLQYIIDQREHWDGRWEQIKPSEDSIDNLTPEQLVVRSKMEEWNKFNTGEPK